MTLNIFCEDQKVGWVRREIYIENLKDVQKVGDKDYTETSAESHLKKNLSEYIHKKAIKDI